MTEVTRINLVGATSRACDPLAPSNCTVTATNEVVTANIRR
ncbi:MAG: hypothetical protein QM516_02295 [Limnohabitans sp.]|nr:hypothetical protein [Limnohabitans sp.]